MNKLHTPRAMQERGLTLIELLVAVTIGLVVTLAVTSAVIFGESTKRTTTSVNDMGQSGSYAAYVLDRAVRSAGSGFAQSWDLGVFGCKPQVKKGATTILPRTTAFPAPFEKFLGGAAGSANLRVAPVVIGKGQSPDGVSDVLMVMSGNGAAGDVPRPIIAAGASANILRLDNTVQLNKNDLTLISQVGADCLLEQVDSTFVDSASNELLPLGGTNAYYTAGSGTTLAALAASGSAYLTLLGNDTAKNVQFQLFGVSNDRTLFSYDLLRSNGTDTPQALADGVMEMHAIYGVDSNKDGILDAWAAPDSADYGVAAKMAVAGTTAAEIAESTRKIVAVRVGLLLRSSTLERDEVTLKIPAMFSGTGVARAEVNLPAGDARRYRYRVVELTIPLRNLLLLPSS